MEVSGRNIRAVAKYAANPFVVDVAGPMRPVQVRMSAACCVVSSACMGINVTALPSAISVSRSSNKRVPRALRRAERSFESIP